MKVAVTIILLLVYASLSAQSLQQVTDATCFFDAIAIRKGINPSELTKEKYRIYAAEYAAEVGLVYDGTSAGNLTLLYYVRTRMLRIQEPEARTRNEIDAIRAASNPRKQLALLTY